MRAVRQLRPPSSETSTRLILPRPDHASPEITVKPFCFSGACGDGEVMTDFASITKVNWRALPFSIRSVYFAVSSRVNHGCVADLEAAQPLDPDIAFPARHHEPRRIALLGPQHLAVHAIGDEAIVERLARAGSSGHRGGVGAFRQHPFRVRLDARPRRAAAQRHAGVLHAMHHAVGVLAAVELRAAPLHAGIGGAFEEIDPVDARKALEIVEREDQRLVDQAVHHQPVVVRIDLGDAAVMALEAEPVRRDDAVELVQRREADRGFRRRGQPRHGAADDILFVFRRLAVGAHTDAVAELARPVGDVGRQVFRISGECARCARGRQPGRPGKKPAARRAFLSSCFVMAPSLQTAFRRLLSHSIV